MGWIAAISLALALLRIWPFSAIQIVFALIFISIFRRAPRELLDSCARLGLALFLGQALLIVGLWLAAWRQLGHPPRPSIDEPQGLGPVLGGGQVITKVILILFISTLPVVAATLAAGMNHPRTRYEGRWPRRSTAIVATVLGIALGVFYVRDPLNIIAWLRE
jgi:hypothetical protein